MGLTSIIMMVSIVCNQETTTITATFDRFEEEVYYFTDDEDEAYNFEKIDPDALKEFDLKDEKYHNKKFKVTYKEEKVIDKEKEESIIWVIVKLELVK